MLTRFQHGPAVSVARCAVMALVLVGVGASVGSRVAAQDRGREVVSILAERFSFTPSEVRVTVGTTVELRVRSDDTMHGFRIVGGGIDIAVPKRRQGEAVVMFEAREVGRYEFECSRLCGAGHNFMRGAIVVVGAGE